MTVTHSKRTSPLDVPHESAHLHVSGRARYVDDLPQPEGMLHAAVGLSERAHAKIEGLDLSAVRSSPGVVAVLTAADVPGSNNHGPILHDDPLFADGVVEYVGQVIFAVVAESTNQARQAARRAKVSYADGPALLNLDQAVKARETVMPTPRVSRGDAKKTIEQARHRVSGSLEMGGQDHFYLEGQIAVAIPGEDNDLCIYSSTQHPTEVQHLVAHCLALQSKDVTVHCRRMGGGFGGKETQPALFACIAAIAARRCHRAVKLRVDRDVDMAVTGKRHPYRLKYEAGFDDTGRVAGVEMEFFSDCGRSADLSGPVNARTVFHADNCYYLDAAEVSSHCLKTHRASNTAFRGFGGPQGMLGIEVVLDEIARYLGVDPLAVRLVNLYGGAGRDETHYGMKVEDNIAQRIIEELVQSSNYAERRRAIERANQTSPVYKRGIALTPVKFGISFTARHYNQAGALIHIYRDGSIALNHGGTEMGQGLFTKVAQIVARAFQVDLSTIRSMATDTGKVPNTSATAASAGTDLNGMAALNAAEKLKARLAEVAAGKWSVPAGSIRFEEGGAVSGANRMAFSELTELAYMERVSLSATGFYRTPRISYDPQTLQGRPFYYFCYGAAVSEVAIDTLTGESKLLRVDILHDVGRSLNDAIDRGQIEGGFMQGVGWLTSEQLVWNDSGRLMTHSPSTYKIPTASDWPDTFNVEIAAWSENVEDTVFRSKAVGEPPFMLAMSVFQAIRHAIGACGPSQAPIQLEAPATPENILRAINKIQEQGPGAGGT